MAVPRFRPINFVKSSTVEDFTSLPDSTTTCSTSTLRTGPFSDTDSELFCSLLTVVKQNVDDECVCLSSTSAPSAKQEKRQPASDTGRKLKRSECTERDKRLFFQAATHGDTEALDNYLVNFKDVNIDYKDEYGWTSLMCAAAEGNLKSVEFLVDRGADVDICDPMGNNAEAIASSCKHQAVCQYFKKLRNKNKTAARPEKTKSEVSEVFCEQCRSWYTDSSHYTSIAHLMTSSKPVETPGYSIPEWNVGYQMLQKTGWQETKGLGKNQEGNRYPIRTALKRDRKGLGLEKNIVKRVTHPDAHKDAPRVKNSSRTAIKDREEQLRKEQRLAIRVRREFM